MQNTSIRHTLLLPTRSLRRRQATTAAMSSTPSHGRPPFGRSIGTKCFVALLCCGAMGCDGRAAVSGDADLSDAHLDAGMPTAPLPVSPGSLALRVGAARQAGDGTVLELVVEVANGTGGAPAPLSPLAFHVETSTGLLIVGGGTTPARVGGWGGLRCCVIAGRRCDHGVLRRLRSA